VHHLNDALREDDFQPKEQRKNDLAIYRLKAQVKARTRWKETEIRLAQESLLNNYRINNALLETNRPLRRVTMPWRNNSRK